MPRKIPVAVYIGDQEMPGGNRLPLYNVVLPDGIRNNKLRITHPIHSTVSQTTLQQYVPNLILPKNPVPYDRRAQTPPGPESTAFALI